MLGKKLIGYGGVFSLLASVTRLGQGYGPNTGLMCHVKIFPQHEQLPRAHESTRSHQIYPFAPQNVLYIKLIILTIHTHVSFSVHSSRKYTAASLVLRFTLCIQNTSVISRALNQSVYRTMYHVTVCRIMRCAPLRLP